MADADYFANPSVAIGNAMRKTNAQLHAHAIDDSLSGTTAVVALLKVGEAGPTLILTLSRTLAPTPTPISTVTLTHTCTLTLTLRLSMTLTLDLYPQPSAR